jgi:hypothetical protein
MNGKRIPIGNPRNFALLFPIASWCEWLFPIALWCDREQRRVSKNRAEGTVFFLIGG